MPSASNTSKTRTSGLIDRQVGALLERDAVELVRGEEHAVLEHVVELEVRRICLVVERVLRLAHLLRVVLPSPTARA